jgi:hypothetical protein
MRSKVIHNQVISPWSQDEENLLRSCKGKTKTEILKLFPNRSLSAITNKRKHLKLGRLMKNETSWNKNLSKSNDLRIFKASQKQSATLLKRAASPWNLGRSPWNKGLTALTNARVKEISIKSTKTLIIHILDGSVNLSSNSFKGAYYRNDLDKYFRSRWEANFVRLLNFFNIKWEYESKKCRIKTNYGILILDFYLPEFDMYIEVKGFLHEKCKLKLSWLKDNLDIEVKIIDEEVYKALKDTYSSQIKNWE